MSTGPLSPPQACVDLTARALGRELPLAADVVEGPLGGAVALVPRQLQIALRRLAVDVAALPVIPVARHVLDRLAAALPL